MMMSYKKYAAFCVVVWFFVLCALAGQFLVLGGREPARPDQQAYVVAVGAAYECMCDPSRVSGGGPHDFCSAADKVVSLGHDAVEFTDDSFGELMAVLLFGEVRPAGRSAATPACALWERSRPALQEWQAWRSAKERVPVLISYSFVLVLAALGVPVVFKDMAVFMAFFAGLFAAIGRFLTGGKSGRDQ